jgi:protein arginine kinase
MARASESTGSWHRLVLASGPRPAWLGPDAPHRDVVVSSRVRVMRNLRDLRFPTSAPRSELESARDRILRAAKDSGLGLHALKALSAPERDFLIQTRLLAPDFEATAPGRALLLNEDRSVSVMVNEEDHLRVQAISGGWAIRGAETAALNVVAALERDLPFAHDPRWGFLAASPPNCGHGIRTSVLVHLIGLARTQRVVEVMKLLRSHRLVVRGLFGEGTRSVGGFFQISQLAPVTPEMVGTVEYLLTAETTARNEISRSETDKIVQHAIETAVTAKTLTYADALKLLSHVRWGAAVGLMKEAVTPRDVDEFLTHLDARSSRKEVEQNRSRAVQIRAWLEPWLRHV